MGRKVLDLHAIGMRLSCSTIGPAERGIVGFKFKPERNDLGEIEARLVHGFSRGIEKASEISLSDTDSFLAGSRGIHASNSSNA